LTSLGLFGIGEHDCCLTGGLSFCAYVARKQLNNEGNFTEVVRTNTKIPKLPVAELSVFAFHIGGQSVKMICMPIPAHDDVSRWQSCRNMCAIRSENTRSDSNLNS
jgi:hypothetical protein